MSRGCFQRWAAPFGILVLALAPALALAQEPGPLADWLKARPDSMRRGLLSVTASSSQPCPSPPATADALDPLTGLLPPLIEGLVSSTGQYLVAQSGRDRQTMTMDGYTTDHLYCVTTAPLDPVGPTDQEVPDQQIRYHLNLSSLVIASPSRSPKDESAFRVELAIQASEDHRGFRLLPSRIDYPAPILNPRAYGVLLQVAIEDLQGQSTSAILPLGFSPCGRVGQRCTLARDQAALNSVASPWLPLPVVTTPVTAAVSSPVSAPSGLARGGQSQAVAGHLSGPITIKARVLEISTYDQILAFLGDFLTLNKGRIADAVVASLPPISEKDRAAARKLQVDAVTARTAYAIAKNVCFSTVLEKQSCQEQFAAWKQAIAVGLEAGIISNLTRRPPPGCQGPASANPGLLAPAGRSRSR